MCRCIKHWEEDGRNKKDLSKYEERNNHRSIRHTHRRMRTETENIGGRGSPSRGSGEAEDRAGGKLGNKGDECAITAIKMIDFKQKLTPDLKNKLDLKYPHLIFQPIELPFLET